MATNQIGAEEEDEVEFEATKVGTFEYIAQLESTVPWACRSWWLNDNCKLQKICFWK